MNGIKKIFFCLLFFIFFINIQAQQDTTDQEINLFNSACKLIDSSKYKDAIVVLKKALKIKPDYYQAYNKMAFAKVKLGDYKGAEKDILSAIKITPDNYDSHKALGILYFETKKFKESIASLD